MRWLLHGADDSEPEPRTTERVFASDEGLPPNMVEALRFARVNGIDEEFLDSYKRIPRAGLETARPDALYDEIRVLAAMRRRGLVEPDVSADLHAKIEAYKRGAKKKKK